MLRVPPGRKVISLKSASVCGFVTRPTTVTRATTVRGVSPVSVDTVVFVTDAVLPAVVGPLAFPLAALWTPGAGPGSVYRQPVRVPHFKYCIMAAKLGTSTPAAVSATLMDTLWRYLCAFICTALQIRAKYVTLTIWLRAKSLYRSVTKGAIFWRVTAVDQNASTYGCGAPTP